MDELSDGRKVPDLEGRLTVLERRAASLEFDQAMTSDLNLRLAFVARCVREDRERIHALLELHKVPGEPGALGHGLVKVEL